MDIIANLLVLLDFMVIQFHRYARNVMFSVQDAKEQLLLIVNLVMMKMDILTQLRTNVLVSVL